VSAKQKVRVSLCGSVANYNNQICHPFENENIYQF
jgi:NADPH-dependent curcumin reductase CurA